MTVRFINPKPPSDVKFQVLGFELQRSVRLIPTQVRATFSYALIRAAVQIRVGHKQSKIGEGNIVLE